jgi:hypothetical protein
MLPYNKKSFSLFNTQSRITRVTGQRKSQYLLREIKKPTFKGFSPFFPKKKGFQPLIEVLMGDGSDDHRISIQKIIGRKQCTSRAKPFSSK